MKLNYKRTILVGFAFFLICAFWQAYDATIPLILTNKFGMSQTWSGVIMALDNILAVFLLPIFGTLSDKCGGKHGKRTPFITIGTTVTAVALVALSFVDAAQLKNISEVAEIIEFTHILASETYDLRVVNYTIQYRIGDYASTKSWVPLRDSVLRAEDGGPLIMSLLEHLQEILDLLL